MNIEILLRYIHFISIFAIVSSLVSEHLLLKPNLKRKEIERLSKIDGFYGMMVLVLLGAGLTLWLGGMVNQRNSILRIFFSKLSWACCRHRIIVDLPDSLFHQKKKRRSR